MKRVHNWSSIILISLSLGAMISTKSSLAFQVDVPAAEYAVFTAVIETMLSHDGNGLGTQVRIGWPVIKDRTFTSRDARIRPEEDWKIIADNLPGLSREVIRDFQGKNKASYGLNSSFNLKDNFAFINKKEIKSIFKNGPDWDEFYRRYPGSGGYTGFSRVGFNRERDRAFVYVDHHCGPLCGTGFFVLLGKHNEEWKILKRIKWYIS